MQSSKTIKQLSDLLEHKQFVLATCNKMAKWLFSQDEDDLAFGIIQRALVHDNSKFEQEELSCMLQIADKNDSMTNPNYVMTDDDKRCIEIHWRKNRHHPEYFEKPQDMEELDVIEMVCDWYARSLQLGTNFMEFVETRQNNRFHFPDYMYSNILKYCNILLESEQGEG